MLGSPDSSVLVSGGESSKKINPGSTEVGCAAAVPKKNPAEAGFQ
jgi:hypothetical protein